MSVKPKISFIELLEKRQRQIFFDQFDAFGSEPSIPEEIRCKECGGKGGIKSFGAYDECVTCNGTGVPPIPTYEILGPKRRSKVKK